MHSKFEKLAEDKKQKIIAACIAEFSQNGYKNASTNNIVKSAEISKGLLFHYFSNKKRLYLYIFDYVLDCITAKLYEKMTDLSADFFERIMQTGIIKLQVAHEHPEMYKILLDAFTQAPDDVKQEVQQRYEKIYKESMPMLLNNVDTSKFRKDIDKNKAMELIMFALEGVSNKYTKSFKDMPVDKIMPELERITEEYNEYIKILKNGVY